MLYTQSKPPAGLSISAARSTPPYRGGDRMESGMHTYIYGWVCIPRSVSACCEFDSVQLHMYVCRALTRYRLCIGSGSVSAVPVPCSAAAHPRAMRMYSSTKRSSHVQLCDSPIQSDSWSAYRVILRMVLSLMLPTRVKHRQHRTNSLEAVDGTQAQKL